MDRLNKFDRYKTQAERSLQRALANVLAFHKENVRTRQWQQLHELRQQKFEIQRERFELAKAREARLAAKSQKSETSVANKADSEIRFAKNAFSSPQKNTPEPPEPNIEPATSAHTAPNAKLQRNSSNETSFLRLSFPIREFPLRVGYAHSSGPKPIRKLFTQLVPYVRPYRWMAFALLFSLVFEAGLETATRWSFGVIIDQAVKPRNYKRLLELLELLGSAAVLLAAVSITADYVWAKLGARVLSDLRSDVYMHVQTLSLDFFQRRKSGDLLAVLIGDPETIESCLVTVVPYALLGISGIVMSSSVMASIHPMMAAATVVGTAICFLLPRAFLGRANRASFAMREQEGRMSSAIQETLQSQYIIKAFGLERELFNRFRRETQSLVDLTVKANFLSYVVERIPAVSFFILCLGIIGGSAVVAFHGGMSIGQVISFQVLALGLGSAIGNLTWLAPLVVSATAGLERINEVLNERPALPEKPGAKTLKPFSENIRFEHVSFAYPPSKDEPTQAPHQILKDLTLEIPRGQFVVIVGASGSGKTTLLQLILRLYDPTQGAVLFDGVDLRDVTVASLRSQIGFVGQDVLLFDSTIRDNIRMGKLNATDREVLDAMQAAECLHLVKKLPKASIRLSAKRARSSPAANVSASP